MKTIIFGIIIVAIAFFSIRKLFRVLKGEESGCESCGKKGSCSKYEATKKWVLYSLFLLLMEFWLWYNGVVNFIE